MIYELLMRGAENALSITDLLKITGCKSARELQSVIASERDRGCVILSNCQCGGYFLPDEGEKGRREIAQFVRTLRQRALHTLRAAKTAQEVLSGLENQIEIGAENRVGQV